LIKGQWRQRPIRGAEASTKSGINNSKIRRDNKKVRDYPKTDGMVLLAVHCGLAQ
jgi:hypothetical protein